MQQTQLRPADSMITGHGGEDLWHGAAVYLGQSAKDSPQC